MIPGFPVPVSEPAWFAVAAFSMSVVAPRLPQRLGGLHRDVELYPGMFQGLCQGKPLAETADLRSPNQPNSPAVSEKEVTESGRPPSNQSGLCAHCEVNRAINSQRAMP